MAQWWADNAVAAVRAHKIPLFQLKEVAAVPDVKTQRAAVVVQREKADQCLSAASSSTICDGRIEFGHPLAIIYQFVSETSERTSL